jgi:hypothetical protein
MGSALQGAYLRWLEIVAREMIDQYWPQVEAVANELIEKRSLSGKELEDVIRASFQASMRAAQSLDFETVETIDEQGNTVVSIASSAPRMAAGRA